MVDKMTRKMLGAQAPLLLCHFDEIKEADEVG